MPEKLNYMAELGVDGCMALYKRKLPAAKVVPLTNCYLYEGSKNTDGYGQGNAKCLLGEKKSKAYLMHVAAFVAFNRFHRYLDHQISHLCNVPNCFNPAHLVSENFQQNNSRKGCVAQIFCSVHGHLIVDTCLHTPKCIRRRRDDVFCCLCILRSGPGWRDMPGGRESVSTVTSTHTLRPGTAGSSIARPETTDTLTSVRTFDSGVTTYEGEAELEAEVRKGWDPVPFTEAMRFDGNP